MEMMGLRVRRSVMCVSCAGPRPQPAQSSLRNHRCLLETVGPAFLNVCEIHRLISLAALLDEPTCLLGVCS